MDLGLRSSAYHEVQDESYDGREYEVELAEVPKSRYVVRNCPFVTPFNALLPDSMVAV